MSEEEERCPRPRARPPNTGDPGGPVGPHPGGAAARGPRALRREGVRGHRPGGDRRTGRRDPGRALPPLRVEDRGGGGRRGRDRGRSWSSGWWPPRSRDRGVRDQLQRGCRAYMEACADPTMARILADAPAVLGVEACRAARCGRLHPLAAERLRPGRRRRAISVPGDPDVAAALLLGFLNEAAGLIAAAPDDQRPAGAGRGHRGRLRGQALRLTTVEGTRPPIEPAPSEVGG